MAQQIHAGQYRLELDGHQLVVRDLSGHVVETIDQVEASATIHLPDGTTVSGTALADALADPKVTEIDTAAGGDTPSGATGAQESGGLGLTAFAPGSGIGGFSAVGGLGGTTLSYGEPSFTDPRSYVDGQAFYKITQTDTGEAATYAPIAEVVNLEANEDTAINGAAVATDLDKDPLGYTLVDGPQHGTLQFETDGTFTYKPDANYHGTDSFTYTANDGSHDSNVAVVNITVTPVNDAPVANDGHLTIDEDATFFGAVTASDVDGDKLGYTVVDGPQHGTLQLNDDGSFVYTPTADYNGADSFTYKANDGGLNSNVAKVDITVKPVNDAPVVVAHDATGDVHVINLDGTQKLNGSIGDYLATAGKESVAINAALVNGVDTSTLTLTQSAEMKVNFLSEGAGYRSMVGTYTFDASGAIDPSSVKFLWLDGTAVKENTANAALVKDFLGNTQPGTVSLGQLSSGTQVGFFIISDGASNAANKALIGGIAGVSSGSDNYASDLAAINSKLGVTVDSHGNAHITVNGTTLNGNTYFTHDAVLNTDANSNDMLHAISGISTNNDGKLYIGFEDLAGGGDKDYNDIIIAVDIGSYNINKLTQGVAQPTVHITDVDSTTLSGATVTTTGFHAGDHLNIPSSSLFDVTTTTNGNDTTIQVTAKSGTESIGNFESFLNGIYFSSSSTEEGPRTVHYAVTDSSGLASNIGDAHVVLTASYDISVSTLGSKTELGAGNDTLHLNQTMSGNLDAGSGYDIARLEQTNMSFGHNEAAKLRNFEVLDATSSGKNAVTLSVDDALTMTDINHHLTVIGNSGDSLKLIGDGTNHWQVTHADTDFTTVAFNDGTHQAVITVSNELSLTVS